MWEAHSEGSGYRPFIMDHQRIAQVCRYYGQDPRSDYGALSMGTQEDHDTINALEHLVHEFGHALSLGVTVTTLLTKKLAPTDSLTVIREGVVCDLSGLIYSILSRGEVDQRDNEGLVLASERVLFTPDGDDDVWQDLAQTQNALNEYLYYRHLPEAVEIAGRVHSLIRALGLITPAFGWLQTKR